MAEEKHLSEISWRAAERDHRERGWLWYAILGGGALFLFTLAMLQRNFFFGVFVILAAGVVFAAGSGKPKVLDFKINEHGVTVDNRIVYAFEKLDAFCFKNRLGRLDELILKKKAAVNPFVRIPIDSKTAEKAAAFLKKHIPEFEHQDSFMDIVSDWLGF